MNDNKSSSSRDGYLDISAIEDPSELATKIEGFYKQESAAASRLSYEYERVHRFLDGDQWIEFDGNPETGGLWRRLTTSKANDYIPRPVTNYVFDGYQTLKAYLTKNKPRSKVRANTDSYKDKTGAKVGTLCLEANWERLKEQENYEYAAAVMLTGGTVLKKDYWDVSSLQRAKVPRMEMQPQIDPTTGQMIGQSEVQVADPETGDLVYDEIPLGDVNTCIVEPIRFAIDPQATDLHKCAWVMEYSIQSTDWIKETYGREEEGYTGRVDEVLPESGLAGGLRTFQQLKSSSGVAAGGAGRLDALVGGAGGSDPSGNIAIVKEYYEGPSSRHPKGRMVVVANKIPLYVGPSPYEGPSLGDWHPYSECRWEVMAGRFAGKTSLSAGCDINKRINSIDAVIALTRQTMAIPQKINPMGSGLAKDAWTGRPGLVIEARPVDGMLPTTIPGAGPASSVFQEREQAVEDLKTVMGNMDILKGDRPPGVTAASALNMLYEVGTGKLYPVLDRWKRFHESSQTKQLRLMSQKYREPRPAFIKMLKSKNTELSTESLEKFIGEDLYDNCNVMIEAQSHIPKLEAAKQAALTEAAATGVLALDQPHNRVEYLEQMGIAGFDRDIGPDKRRAEWENDLLDNIEVHPDRKPIVLYIDNDDVHLQVIESKMKEPNWIFKSEAEISAYQAHWQEHVTQRDQKKQAATVEQMSMGMPPEGLPSGNAPQSLSPAGKGATVAQRDTLSMDTQIPGGES